ncbi:MAG: glycoside hydrolase family 3 C-terminal domain-containing protein [Muribaculaceae bacterium]|nr:glycoside hydrolase family 3 C-terminal domain-containing protein [Muribaculaceae bacterium]
MKKTIFTFTLLIAVITNAQQTLLTPDNIDEVIKELTLEEKARLLVGRYDNGKGVPGAAGVIQDIERFGLPPVALTDGPAGVRIAPTRPGDTATYYATGFPIGTALACTWNTDLVEEIGAAIGNEVLEYGCDVLLAPGINIHRSPLCGRDFEYFSEDPVLAGNIAAAYVNGVQSNGVGTSVKHFAVNSQETNRFEVDEVVSQRALREIYLKPFQIALSKSNPWTIMSSYNRLNGTWTQSSRELLTDILRDEWGYDGLIMTDWTDGRPSAERVYAGNSLLMPGYAEQETDIIESVRNGSLSMEDVDRQVRHVLDLILKTPHYKGYSFSNKPDLKAHAALTRSAAPEGMVLLENRDSALPIVNPGKVALFGRTSYDFMAGGLGSGDVNKAYIVNLSDGLTNAGFQVDGRLKNYYEAQRNLREKTKEIAGEWSADFEPVLSDRNIARLAEDNDVAVITFGRQAGEWADRHIDNDFNISNDERALLERVTEAFHALGKKVIVVLNTGGVMETASWKHIPDAILLAWQPGQEAGNAVADVISGVAFPSGKLSMTFPLTVSDVPANNNFPTGSGSDFGDARRNHDYTLHDEDIYVGYRYFTSFDKPVSYPFGYGLSYTEFEYGKPVVRATRDGFEASIDVKNTGNAPGKEVVQLYVGAPAGEMEKPVFELKGFAKTAALQPGESQTLRFVVNSMDLASFNEDSSQWQTEAGNYRLMFGASANDIRATASFNQKKPLTKTVGNVLQPNRQLNRLTRK